MRLSAKNKICIIIGDPVDHSLSPTMHNTAYEKLGIDNEFVYLGANVKIDEVKNTVQAMRSLHFRGLTCTMPHKIEVMKYLDKIDPVAKKIGAVNTVVNDNGVLTGYNTDWLGVVIPLEKMTKIKNKNVAVIGAGGAARAVLYGLLQKGAKVTIFNRTLEKAQELAREFGCQATSFDNISAIKNSDIIINATAIGMKPLENELPISEKALSKNQIVFD
ncbi:shikimate dehydrogenase, partial [Candidatus Roizmanbacteria bacterium]|nr:shikimate dehydrogenase [Candidatus Roizmanbacteria bacterium]